jgi:hypothetical protein
VQITTSRCDLVADGGGTSSVPPQFTIQESNVAVLPPVKLDERARMQNAVAIVRHIVECPLLQDSLLVLLTVR